MARSSVKQKLPNFLRLLLVYAMCVSGMIKMNVELLVSSTRITVN